MYEINRSISSFWNLTRREVLLLYPNPLTTIATTTVFTTITNITAANKISTWFQRNWTFINIPMLARKRAAKKLRMGSTCITKTTKKNRKHVWRLVPSITLWQLARKIQLYVHSTGRITFYILETQEWLHFLIVVQFLFSCWIFTLDSFLKNFSNRNNLEGLHSLLALSNIHLFLTWKS